MEYHKIKTIFNRDPDKNHKKFMYGDYSIPEFEYLKDNVWEFTEKIDGTNIRIYYENGKIELQGRTNKAELPKDLVTRINETILPEELKSIFDGESQVVLYGEGCGAKIQKGGGNYYSDQRFVLFDIKIGNFWLKRDDVNDISQQLDLPIAPVIGQGTIGDMIKMTKQGFNSQWGDFKAEGIVARPKTELKGRNGKRIITKVKCKDFPK